MTGAAEALPRASRPRGRATLDATARRYVPPILVAVGALVAWELITGGPGRRVIPPPSAIIGAGASEFDVLRRSAQATFYEATGGLVLGAVAGIVVAFAAARWVTARNVLLPVAIAASAIPIIAVAPILNNWFGVLNPLSKMAMAGLLVFFPVMINVVRGLVEVHPSALELMRSYASSEWSVLFKVRVPNMLPFLFTALKVSTTLAFIGAIVGEYFGGTSEVIGRIVLTSMSSGRFGLAWAGILIGAIGAIASYAVVSLVERLVIPWYASLVASGEG